MDFHKNLLENDGDDGVANVMLWPHFFLGGGLPFFREWVGGKYMEWFGFWRS